LLFPLAGSAIIPVALMTFALAIFNNPVLPLLDSMVLDHIDERGNITYSNIRFWGAPGYGLGAFVTGLLIPHFGVKVAFFTAASFLIIALVSLQFFAPAKSRNKGIDLEFKNLAEILPDRKLLVFLFIIMVVSIGQSAITFFLSIYMREIGATPQVIGTAIGVQGFSELPFYFVAAWLLSRMKPGKVVIIAIVATAIRLFLYSVNSNPNIVVFIETMNGMTWTLLWIASVEHVNKLIPAIWRTTGQSLLWASYFGGGAILGNIISGRLYDLMTMKRVFALNSLMILGIFIVAAFALIINHKKRNSDNAKINA
jgi:PPP family 3-phenylpropionic acid transporter